MSDVQNTAAPVAETPAITEPVATEPVPETTAATEELPKSEPTTEAVAESSKPAGETTEAAAEEKKDEAAPVEEKKDEAAPVEKAIEPITEGQLAFKGPGLLKSLIPSKKECWLSDDAVSPQDLNSYMRGEKPEIAHPVVAWASQTGKGLLFFNKKGDTTKKSPGHVLALYDATDLKKQSPHEIVFKLHSQEHTLKATSDAERDGWYLSLEKAVEIGKASKESVRESEGYKAEMEKLNKPHVSATAGAVAAKRSESKPKKSTEVDAAAAQRANSDVEEEDKKKKSRSTSRGMFDRLKGKKDEAVAKKEEKKEEKEEQKAEKEEAKAEEEHKTEEVVPVAVAGGAAAAGAAGVAADASDDKKAEEKKDEVETPAEAKTEEKPKASKRGSIFGKFGAGLKSPSKEKEQKDAELKPEVPPKDGVVSENPPQLPETTTETTDAPVEADKPAEEVKPEAAKEEVSTPNKEKKNYLSGLSFMNKRGRSVSPSTPMKEAPKKDETPVEAPKEEVAEPAKTEEAAPVEPVVAESADKPAEKAEEPAKTDSTPNKRQSMLGSLGRRASKAFRGMQAPKKENAAPASTDATKEETTEAEPAADKPITNGESKPSEPIQPAQIGDVVPEAVNVGQPQHTSTPTVIASA